jgi:hypothetical protein
LAERQLPEDEKGDMEEEIQQQAANEVSHGDEEPQAANWPKPRVSAQSG